MAKMPSEILSKTKSTDKSDDKDSKKGDDKKPRRNAMLDWIAKSKKAAAK
jgi:hypothetical protein